MDKFYVIKVINNRTGERGYVIDTKEGIMIALGFHISITQFETKKDAYKFIKEKRLEKGGVITLVMSNQDLMNDKSISNLKKMDRDMFHIENKEGEKLFFDSKYGGYFFKKGDAGYPAWYSEEDAKDSAIKLGYDINEIIIIKHENKNKNETKI